MSVRAILEHPWRELEAVLLGKRASRLMMRYTRIVGYWSNTANWNGSALEQLKDRHKGSYTVPDSTRDMDGNTPQIVVEALAAGGAEMACKLAEVAA